MEAPNGDVICGNSPSSLVKGLGLRPRGAAYPSSVVFVFVIPSFQTVSPEENELYWYIIDSSCFYSTGLAP